MRAVYRAVPTRRPWYVSFLRARTQGNAGVVGHQEISPHDPEVGTEGRTAEILEIEAMPRVECVPGVWNVLRRLGEILRHRPSAALE